VTIGWQDEAGQVQTTRRAKVLAPDGSELTSLGPDATADLIVVVDDAGAAERLPEWLPVIVAGRGGESGGDA
jgi:hypothetical protein